MPSIWIPLLQKELLAIPLGAWELCNFFPMLETICGVQLIKYKINKQMNEWVKWCKPLLELQYNSFLWWAVSLKTIFPMAWPGQLRENENACHLQKPFLPPASCMLSHFSHAWLWTVACQAPMSMGFSRREYWNSYHAFLQGITQPRDRTRSPASQADS